MPSQRFEEPQENKKQRRNESIDTARIGNDHESAAGPTGTEAVSSQHNLATNAGREQSVISEISDPVVSQQQGRANADTGTETVERLREKNTLLRVQVGILKAESKSQLWGRIIENGIKWATLAFCVYCFQLVAVAFAGHATSTTHMDVKIVGNLDNLMRLLFTAFGFGGVGFGIKQQSLRKMNNENMGKRVKYLEQLIYSDSESSNLTSRGDTNPEDR